MNTLNIYMKFQQHTKYILTTTLVLATIFSHFSYAQSTEEAVAPTTPKQSFYGKVAGTVSDSTSGLINNAMQLIGVRYRWGEKVQTGFDASAFVKYVFKDNLGFLFPAKTDEMSKVGLQISRDNLKPGDLVFFNTLQRENSHVGIYVGENKFIHAPARGSGVRVDDMTTVYWDKRFDGARRVNPATKDSMQMDSIIK
ncbi:MAG: C40 family peptidase [Crocinitomicaceae bacterium]|nr:C40 family peptidase [Crocinitomicaceae bacterium]